MNRIRILVLAVLCAASAQADGVTITGPIKNADRTNVTGRMTISWDQFISVDGVSIARGTISRTITNGAIVEALVLEPAAVASPVSTYSVTIYPNGGGLYVQRWLVPESGSPLTVGSIIVSSLPAPGLSIALTQLRVTGCAKGGILAMSTSWGCLAGGADGKVLTMDSTKTRGLDWVVPSASGAAFRIAVGGTLQTARAKLNLIAGQNVVLTPADNSGTDATDVTVASTDVLDIARVEPPDDPSVGRVRCYTDEGDSNFKCRDSDGNVSTMIYPIFHETNKMVRWVSTTGHPILEYLPDPSDTLKGGVKSKTCDVGDFVSEIGTNGSVTCDTPSSGGSGTVTVVASGSLPSTAILTGGGLQTVQAPSSTATLDTDGKITAPGGIETGVGGSYSGFAGHRGLTSGGPIGWTVADIAGSPIAYVLPAVAGEAGQVLSDGGTTTCPTLQSGAPTTCHSTSWITPSAGEGSSIGSMTVTAFDALVGNGGYSEVHLTDGVYTAVWDGSAWDYYFRDRQMVRPILGNFTGVNLTSTTTTTTTGAINLYAPAGGDSLRIYVEAPGGTSWTRTVTFIPGLVSANYASAGMILRESGTGKLKTWALSNESTGGSAFGLLSNLYSNATTFTSSSTPTGKAYAFVPGQPITLRIVSDATNLTYYVLPDGITPIQVGSPVARGTGFTSAPDQVGFYVNANNATLDGYITVLSW